MVRILLLFLITCSAAFGQAFTLRSPFPPSTSGNTYDDFESYSDEVNVNALNGGNAWNGAYIDRASINGVVVQDNMDLYSDAASVNGLNFGSGFTSGYVDRFSINGVNSYDTFESYSDTSAVNGLNGGTTVGSAWGGAFVDR